jgi:hypothetical protein
MAQLADVILLLDSSNADQAVDEVNELLRDRQAAFLPGSSLIDYCVGHIEERAIDLARYAEGDAFKAAAAAFDPADEKAMIVWRRQSAQQALEAFATITGLDPRDELDVALADLLANLRHLCDDRNLCFADADRRAHRNYLEELAEAGAQSSGREGGR